MRSLNKDELFAVLLIKQVDGLPLFEAMTLVFGREPDEDELKLFHLKCADMRSGWVDINLRTKRLGN